MAQSLGEHLRQARAALADLERELAVLADPDVVALDDEHDSEGSTIGYERARVASLVDRTRARIARLELAERTGVPTVCAGCGAPIPQERIDALPAVTTCVTCAGRRDDQLSPG